MNATSFLQMLQGPFNFLRSDPQEVRLLLPDLQRVVPQPRLIFLEDETVTPLQGFPVLLSPGMLGLRTALRDYVDAEEAMQVAGLKRESHDARAHAQLWERYVTLLSRAVENATISSYGRQYPAVFWLQHSLDVARQLKDVPRRIARRDSDIGRRHGDAIKYRILDRFLDRVLSLSYDLVQRVAGTTEEVEEELFPRLLTRMRDNVLLFTEEHISRDLAELGSYFTGSLGIDGRDLRKRLDELARWHFSQIAADPALRAVVTHLLRSDPRHDSRDLLNRSGYVAYLSTLKTYDAARLLSPALVQVWEGLLLKLKEFELVHGLRRLIVPIELKGERMLGRELPPGRAVPGELVLSSATRPLDFMEPWVVDPRVERYGMIYDISEFSQTLSMLHRAGNSRQDDAFLAMFRFQRRINRLAVSHRAKLEKYLGDGAFYSSREATNLLLCSVHLQRYYVEAVEEGLPFDRGMRIALNYGPYRLIPMGGRPEEGERYEFFGPGLVELSRLTTGKATQEIDEVKTMLVNQGYPETTVLRFFAPLADKNVDVVDKKEESRRFYAYINRNGTLHNNGMVATGPYIAQLDHELDGGPLQLGKDGDDRPYVVLELEDDGAKLPVGVRKLGLAHLKGLENLAVYEIVDAARFDPATLTPIYGERLVMAVEREFANAIGRASTGREKR